MFLKYLDAKNVLIFSMFLAVLRLDLNKKITFFSLTLTPKNVLNC